MTLSVRDAAAEFPERPALIIGDRTLTFGELARRVRGRKSWLVRLCNGAPDDAPVALVGASDLGTLEVVYAALELGRPIALIHPRFTELERTPLIELVRPVATIDGAASFDHGEKSDEPRPSHIDPERPLAILFTSGTTGRPKGIVLSRRAFIASAEASEKNLGWQADDRWLLGLPIAHVGGLSILTRSLLARRTVVVPAEVAQGKRLDEDALVRVLETNRVTIASLVPTQLEQLLSALPDWSPPPHLRAVLLGGAAARPALLERAADRGVPVLTTYGMTETCSQVTTQSFGSVNRGELGSGPPMAGTELRIVDDAVQVRGPTLLSGTIPKASAPLFDAEGWFSTDDLGRLDDAGRLHVLGRRSDLVITGGENVYPAEVEAVLESCPGVAAACVFGVPDDTWGEIVVVALVTKAHQQPPEDHVMVAYLESHLAKHRRPRLIAFLSEFDVTRAGKLDRAATARRARPLLRALRRG